MDRKKLAKRLIYLIFFILAVNFIASKLYLYSSVSYLDMAMHFLGGFWLSLAAFYIFSPKNISPQTVFKILLFVLVLGIGWEVFEMLVNDVIIQNPLNYPDIISDLCFDLTGGSLAVLYYIKRIVLQSKDHA